jgi:hypothetical protein
MKAIPEVRRDIYVFITEKKIYMNHSFWFYVPDNIIYFVIS